MLCLCRPACTLEALGRSSSKTLLSSLTPGLHSGNHSAHGRWLWMLIARWRTVKQEQEALLRCRFYFAGMVSSYESSKTCSIMIRSE